MPPHDQRRRRVTALVMTAVGAALVALSVSWAVVIADLAPAISPPAGKVLPGSAPFSFAVISDTHDNSDVVEAAIPMMQADGVSLILHCGDVGDFPWMLHELEEEQLSVPLCVVPGNHDIDPAEPTPELRCRRFGQAFGARQYWFAYGNALFVGFDASSEVCTPESLQWLDDTLSRLRDDYPLCFVFMHVPPRDPRTGKNHTLHSGGAELAALLARHNVSAVFAGHIHAYLEDNVDGVPVYIAGGGGGDLYPPETTHHYALCTVAKDGSFRVTKRDVPTPRPLDYAEHAFRTKMPFVPALVLGLGLMAAGLVMLLHSRG